MSVIAFIFARGGSKGLPGKNTRLLGGKPLIAWSIESALQIPRIERVIVSTDSQEIANVALSFGAEVPFMRPAELAKDESSEWLAWRHALGYLLETTGRLPRVMVSIPATAPLRSVIDIEKCLVEYEKGGVDIVITVSDAHRNPYFNMIKKDKDSGLVSLVNPPSTPIVRRQDAPAVYDMATICYVANPEFVMLKNSIFEGRVRAVHIPVERSVDIDTLTDFRMAEYYLNNKA